jgi:hypothetical protein
MKEIAYKILWSTIEDFVGLWELFWEIDTEFSGISIVETQATIKILIKVFLENNLVVVYLGEWGSNRLKALDIDAAINLLEEKRFWNAPELNEVCLKLGCTEKGEKYYNNELLSDLIKQ